MTKPSNLEQLLQTTLESGEIDVQQCDDHVGIRASVSRLYSGAEDDGKTPRVFVQLHVESRLSDEPENEDQGFTDDDVTYETCVSVMSVKDWVKPVGFIGECFTKQEFIKKHVGKNKKEVTDLLAQAEKKLAQMAKPRKSFLDSATRFWLSQMPGEQSMTKPRIIC